jgi:hypothetical protein
LVSRVIIENDYYMKEGGCKEGKFSDDGTIQEGISLFRVESSIKFLIASEFLAVSHRFSKSFSWATWAIAIRALR